jgi:cytochrome c55X
MSIETAIKAKSRVWGQAPALLFGLGALVSCAAGWAEEAMSPERRMELIRLVRNDCGSCHGGRLKGGLGPALSPGSLRDKTPEGLRETILHGRAGGAMPPWSDFLTAEEADWIVEQLMKGFPSAR